MGVMIEGGTVKDALFRQKFTPDLPEIISLFFKLSNNVFLQEKMTHTHIYIYIILLKYHLTSYILIKKRPKFFRKFFTTHMLRMTCVP